MVVCSSDTIPDYDHIEDFRIIYEKTFESEDEPHVGLGVF
jgi:hypothetical protein